MGPRLAPFNGWYGAPEELIRSPRRNGIFKTLQKKRGFVVFFDVRKVAEKFRFGAFFGRVHRTNRNKKRFFGNWGSVSALPVLRFRGVGRFRPWFRNRETLRFCGFFAFGLWRLWWARRSLEKFAKSFWVETKNAQFFSGGMSRTIFGSGWVFSCGAERVLGPSEARRMPLRSSDLLTRSQVPIVLSFSLRRRAFAGSQFHSHCGLARSSSRSSPCGCGFAGFCVDISQHVACVTSSDLKPLETVEISVFGSSGCYP